MSARELVVAKKALIDWVKIRQDAWPALSGVRIDYAFNPRLAEVEYVWGGAARLVSERFTDAAGGMQKTITVELFFDVRALGAELETADERGGDIAEAVETILAADPQLGGTVSGLVFQSLAAGEIEYDYYDDDAAMSSLRVEVRMLLHTRRS